MISRNFCGNTAKEKKSAFSKLWVAISRKIRHYIDDHNDDAKCYQFHEKSFKLELTKSSKPSCFYLLYFLFFILIIIFFHFSFLCFCLCLSKLRLKTKNQSDNFSAELLEMLIAFWLFRMILVKKNDSKISPYLIFNYLS